MRNLTLAVVVGGVLASASAGAANYDLFIGGASAQSAFWKADFGTSVCGGAANVSTYTIVPAGTVSNEAWRCTVAVTTVTGLVIGDVVTVHYNSELGTISAVAPLANPGAAPRLFVNPDSALCAGAAPTFTCTLGGVYTNTTETVTGGDSLLPMEAAAFGGARPAPATFHQFDIGVLDVEIKHWSLPQNWTDATFNVAMGTVPSKTTLLAVPGVNVMNGQVFSVIANNAGPAAAVGNLSKNSLMAIMKGQYNVWGDVPEVGGGNATPIKLCRREYGSGTQVAASIFFTGLECGYSSQAFASIAAPGSLPSVVENASTALVRTCVQGDVGGIGVTSLSTSANYATLNIDGVQANAHNAAAGIYQFAYETHVYNRSGATGSGAAAPMVSLAGALIDNAKRAARLTSQIEAGAVLQPNGQYVVTAGQPRRVAYALPIGGFNAPATLAKMVGDVIAPISVFPAPPSIDTASVALTYDAGDNCKVSFNSNTL